MTGNKTFLIGSTGTEIGKTYISVLIIKELIKKNFKVLTLKPILSGFDYNNIHDWWMSDEIQNLRIGLPLEPMQVL